MDDDLNQKLTKKDVRKWAQEWARRYRDLRKSLDRAGDDFDGVLKTLDVDAPTWRAFRNQARKLKRESTTPTRFQRGVLKLVDGEIKAYGKLADSLVPKD